MVSRQIVLLTFELSWYSYLSYQFSIFMLASGTDMLMLRDKHSVSENGKEILGVAIYWEGHVYLVCSAGLQITVGHRTMADQNLPMSDEIATLVGHFVWPIFCCNI